MDVGTRKRATAQSQPAGGIALLRSGRALGLLSDEHITDDGTLNRCSRQPHELPAQGQASRESFRRHPAWAHSQLRVIQLIGLALAIVMRTWRRRVPLSSHRPRSH
jgi:hypothetical protein